MAESTDTLHETVQKTWKRRGLFAAAWAAVVGVVLKQTTQPVEAVQTNLVFSSNDPFATFLNYPSTPIYVVGQDPFGSGGDNAVLQVYCTAVAVDAIAGDSTSGSGRHGVVGKASATNTVGVMGQIPASSTNHNVAVYAVNASSFAGSAPGAGGFGLYGVSFKGPGVFGAAGTAGATGIAGWDAGITGAYAGVFFGSVIVEGNFTVLGGAKSAAVPHPDGTHRRLYCVESPESWFEDFGETTLACGEATIALDPDFTAVADTAKYHVFLTGYDGQADLSVCERTAAGFRVRSTSATGAGTFSWRVVAKRKDIAASRFETVAIPVQPPVPNIPEPTVSDPLVPHDRSSSPLRAPQSIARRPGRPS